MCYLNWFWNSPLCRGSFHPETIPAGAAGETVLTTYRKAAEQSNTVSPHHCFQETSGRFSPFLAAKTLDCRFKQDTWPTVTRGFCADAKTEDELGVFTTWDWKLNPKKPNLWHTEIKALDVDGVLLTCVCLFSASQPATLHLTDSDRTSNIKIL